MGKKLINPLLEVKQKDMNLINPFRFGSPIPTNGLIAYYPFNGNANDESGNGNNGTVSNATLAVGRKGDANHAYLFSKASSSYINISSIGHLPSFTYSMWIKDNGTDNGGIFAKSNFSNQQGDYCVAFGSPVSNFFPYRINNNAYELNINKNFDDGNWHHLVVIYNNSTMKVIYDNGTPITRAAASSINNTYASIRLGNYFSNSFSFNGWMDDVRVFNRELTPDEITLLFNE